MTLRSLFATLLLATTPHSLANVLESFAPDSLAVGSTVGFFQARVHDGTGVGVGGLAYRFETDPACGSFGGAAEVSGVTDPFGTADAGPFAGLAVTLSCATWLHVEGIEQALDLSVHVFDPARVVLLATPSAITSEAGERYSFRVTAMESGFLVNAYPESGSVSTAPSGASASLVEALVSINSGVTRVTLQANGKPGKYEIGLDYSGSRLVVPVTQRMASGSR